MKESEISNVKVSKNTFYSGSVVKTKIQTFFNEPIYVAELGGASIKQHDQSAVPDNNMMWVSDC